MITCIIIEDEPLAMDVMVDYTNQVPSLKLKGTFPDAMQAVEVLNREPIDLMFLDIHLPGLKGLDFLDTLVQPPRVILTTAYPTYALRGYEHNVVDYLLKPIEFKRFLQAVNKLFLPSPRPAAMAKEYVTIFSDKRNVLIPVEDILFIESQKEYIKVQTKTTFHVSKCTLTRLESELDPTKFLRIHRSFIASLGKVNAYNNREVEIAGNILPVGASYREAVGRTLDFLYARQQNVAK